jgi:YgiT-type zinc finger domain-containing protein
MKCVICRHGETKHSSGTVTLERGATTIVFKKVPAEICANCGEKYYDERVTAELLGTAEEAARSGVQVDVREYQVA